MSQHRYPCTAEPPPPALTDTAGHQHACIHDAPAQPVHRPIEHQCACGMTWRMASYWPAPDTSWLSFEPPPKRAKLWAGVAIAAPVLIVAALVLGFAWAVTR